MDHQPFCGDLGSLKGLWQGLGQAKAERAQMDRPFVMVSYAQSIDGSIATIDRRPVRLSGQASMALTHRLRSLFDAIAVGIDTVLTDNPQLTVRLAEGRSPQPIVLDTHLRIPAECHLLQRRDRRSWLASAPAPATERVRAVTSAGATILSCPLNRDGQIDIGRLMHLLHDKGIGSLMVEGGARVITSFLRAELVDLLVITIAPTLIGGLQVIQNNGTVPLPRLNLTDIHYERLEDDLILWAKPVWNGP